MSGSELLVLALAAAAAGAVNALAGGGTLISFPVLLALGVPPIAANVTNALALCPGYFGATLAQRRQLTGQAPRLLVFIPAAVAGGFAGALILLHTHERTFQSLVPFMLLAASLLLAFQERVRAFALRRAAEAHEAQPRPVGASVAVFAAGIYGGFFSAGMSVILLAVLAAMLDDEFTRVNALKQIAAFGVNVAAAVLFLFSGRVVWFAAAVMALGAMAGGALGGRIAGHLNPVVLRWLIVSVGLVLATYYWVKG